MRIYAFILLIFACLIYTHKFMLKEERHQYILKKLKQDYRVQVTMLSEELLISDDTLRRDLAELNKLGLLTRVHGGAIAKSGIPVEFTKRLDTGIPEKQELAKKAIPLFSENDIILIDGGTSNLELARQLPNDIHLTIYTNSFPVVNELIDRESIDLMFLGGKVFPSSRITTGVPVIKALQTFTADWYVLGASNIHPEKGTTDPNREEAFTKIAMTERSRQILVLGDSYKLNTAETYTTAQLSHIDYLIVKDEQVHQIKSTWLNDAMHCTVI